MRARRSREALPLWLALGLAACSPPSEADYALSNRAEAAPPPSLEPTGRFGEPLEAGREAVARLGPERDALATRAAALRDRGAALSSGAVIDDDRRARLEDRPTGDVP